MSSEIQAVLFDKKYWTKEKAQKELNKMEVTPIKPVHVTNQYLRYRIRDPREFERMTTKKTSKNIDIIIGFY